MNHVSSQMMIPKHSRGRRKQISNHDTHSTASSSNKLSVANDLPTITRTSNHTPIHSASNHSSESSWIELDFNKPGPGNNTFEDTEIKKPVSSIAVNMDLEDDEESKSSKTSRLSEDFTGKGDFTAKGSRDDDENSVTSFASESSFAVDVPLDDFFTDSPMPNSNKPSKAPTSYRSDTKPSSERSKPVSDRSKKPKKHVSPRNKASKKKSKSPMPVQARKRLTDTKAADDSTKEPKKGVSPKRKPTRSSSTKRRSSSSSSKRRSGSQPPPPPPPLPQDDDEQLLALVDERSTSDAYKKKVKKSSSRSPRTRRRRLRPEDLQSEESRPGSSRSLEAKTRRRTKSKSKHRKAPSRSSSNPDIAAARELRRRFKKKEEEAAAASELASKSRSSSRVRSKRTSNGHESEDDTSKMTSKSRSSSRNPRKKRTSNGNESEDDMSNVRSLAKDGKKKTRSKSSDPKGRTARESEAARKTRRKKKPSKGDTQDENSLVPPSPVPPSPMPQSTQSPDEDDDIDPRLQPESGPMEIMTYSFHCGNDETENKKADENWLQGKDDSSSSSLSCNSFAQFALDLPGLVTDIPDAADGPNAENGVGIVPDFDASVASFGTMDASVVFMSGSKSGNRVSMLSAASHSFDNDEELDEGDDKSGLSAHLAKPEKQLRRRLKKGDGSVQQQSVNQEVRKKVRRAKSNNLEQIQDSLVAGMAANENPTRKGIERTKSHNEAIETGSSKLVASKASRRKKEKSLSTASAKSRSAHNREISRSPTKFSPKNKMQRDKLAAIQSDFFDDKDATTSSVKDSDNKLSSRSPKPSPKPSPREQTRGVRRTFSNPLAAMGLHSSTGDRRALLSSSADDDSDEEYSTHSAKKSFLPKRGLERTPSQMLGGLRDKMKKTFSVSGHGRSTFDADLDDVALGMRTENGYMGVKERRRLIAQSADRRGQVKNSLYACMDDSDSSDVDISAELSRRDDSDNESATGKSIGHGSVSSEKRRHKQTGPPRRVNSLPMHRRSPYG